MELLTANKNGKSRVETMNGRTYFVLPMRIIVPGVLTGNRGSLLYREKEIAESLHAWNNVPIVVDHPKKDGTFISARSPQVIAKSGVGYVFNAKQVNGNLDAEAWIDIEKLSSVEPDMADRVRRGEQVEVSSGLGTYNQAQEGTYNGRAYTHVAKNFAPDHVALLTSEVGACSLKDGCGLSVNQMKKLVEDYESSGTELTFSQWQTVNEGKAMCRCNGKCKKCAREQQSEFRFQPKKSVTVNQTFTFQPTINAEESDGVWRTTDGGSKIFIKGGQAYAGGPNGKALGSGKKGFDVSKVATDKETQKEYESSGKDIKQRIADYKNELKNTTDKDEAAKLKKDLASWEKKLKQNEEILSHIKSQQGKEAENPKKKDIYFTESDLEPVGKTIEQAASEMKEPASEPTKSKKGFDISKVATDKETLKDYKDVVKGLKEKIEDHKQEIKQTDDPTYLKNQLGALERKLDHTEKIVSHIESQRAKQSESPKKSDIYYVDDQPASQPVKPTQSQIHDAVMMSLSHGKVTESDYHKWNSGSQTSDDGNTHVGMKVKVDKEYGGKSGHVVGYNKNGSFALVKIGSKVESIHSSNIKQSTPKKK